MWQHPGRSGEVGEQTGIAWTDSTLNPWIGCTKVSPACDFCYAEALNKRWGHDNWGQGKPRRRTSEATWRNPLRWDREAANAGERRRVFCASLADVFDSEVPEEWRHDLWELIRKTPNLDWQLLTKRPLSIAKMLPADWGVGWPNVWLGTTVEGQQYDWRVEALLTVPARIRFVSAEPLLAPWHPHMAARRGRLHWIITGGESGHGARPCDPDWVRAIRDDCVAHGVAYFHKQWGGRTPKAGGKELDGFEWCQFPSPREFEEAAR